jgi:hypothetical protein
LDAVEAKATVCNAARMDEVAMALESTRFQLHE